jgi:hypothetical protein
LANLPQSLCDDLSQDVKERTSDNIILVAPKHSLYKNRAVHLSELKKSSTAIPFLKIKSGAVFTPTEKHNYKPTGRKNQKQVLYT